MMHGTEFPFSHLTGNSGSDLLPEEDAFSYYYTFFQDAFSPEPEEDQTGQTRVVKKMRAEDSSPEQTYPGYYEGFTTSAEELDCDFDFTAAAGADNTVTTASAGISKKRGRESNNQRRLWVKDRSQAWWDMCSSPDFPDSEFRKAFRMSRATFDALCAELGSAIAKEDTTLRAAIPVPKRVAVCLWRLATGEPLRLVSKRFGLGISTCHKLVLEVCSAIKSLLMPRYLYWPQDATTTKSRFESLSGIPDVVGAMYTTHIPIVAPKNSTKSADYLNRRHTERNQKASYSITVQGVVDPDGVFTDVCIGWPGSMSDDQVLENSSLYRRPKDDPSWVVGGAGYPLLDWVLVPYTQKNLTWAQHAFNQKMEDVKGLATEAFRRLKGRWKCLQKRTEVKVQDLPVVLGACCVLHNFCEMRREGMEQELWCEVADDEVVPEISVRSGEALPKRDRIAHNLLHHGLANGVSLF